MIFSAELLFCVVVILSRGDGWSLHVVIRECSMWRAVDEGRCRALAGLIEMIRKILGMSNSIHEELLQTDRCEEVLVVKERQIKTSQIQ